MSLSNPKETWKGNRFLHHKGSHQMCEPPKDPTKGVDLKGRTMAIKPIGTHEQYLKDKGKATLQQNSSKSLKKK